MRRPARRLLTVPALMLALLVGACDRAAEPGSIAGPDAELLTDTAGEEASPGLVDGTPPSEALLTTEAWIGPEGGSLSTGGHTLSVPAGAVDQSALFTMRLATSGVIEVDLEAAAWGADGKKNVGGQGFKRPVVLTMTYSWAAKPVRRPAGLSIVYLRDDGTQEPLQSTVHPGTKTVSAQLKHFSRYAMSSN